MKRLLFLMVFAPLCGCESPSERSTPPISPGGMLAPNPFGKMEYIPSPPQPPAPPPPSLCVDRGLHLLIREDSAFHDSTGNAPLGGEEEDHGLAGVGSLLLSRGVVAGPGDVVGG